MDVSGKMFIRLPHFIHRLICFQCSYHRLIMVMFCVLWTIGFILGNLAVKYDWPNSVAARSVRAWAYFGFKGYAKLS